MARLPPRRPRTDDAKKGEDKRDKGEDRRGKGDERRSKDSHRPQEAVTDKGKGKSPAPPTKKRTAAAASPTVDQPSRASASTATDPSASASAKKQKTTHASASTSTPAVPEVIAAEEAAEMEKAIQLSLHQEEDREAPILEWDLVPDHIQLLEFEDLLIAHGTCFNREDDGVPRELNDDWEILKCLFIKWYYVFSRLPRDEKTALAIWRIFLFTYHDQELISKLKDLAREGKVRIHKVSPFKKQIPPRQYGQLDESRIEHEVRLATAVHGLMYEEHKEEYQRLALNIYNLYHVPHLYKGQKII